MAEVTVKAVSITRAAGNWQTGAATDIDEGIPGADGNLLETDTDGEGELVDVAFESTGLSDADEITQVDLIVRHIDGTDADSDLSGQLLIGGVAQGSPATPVHRASLTNDTLNDVGWNSDWTASQINGAEGRFIATQGGMPTADKWGIDTVDMKITFNPASAGNPWNYYAQQ